jgi:hypothetical protein
MSKSFFKKAASDPSSLGKDFAGQNYIYSKFIKTPTELGMSDGGSLSDFAKNVSGLMNYVTVLSEGGGKASKARGKNLGDRYFLSTGAHCKDPKGNTVKRSLYIDNVANGASPILKELGIGDESLNGLIPGLLNDVLQMNPVAIFGAFMQGSEPACTNIHMKTVDEKNKNSTGSGFVINSEIKNINPCSFVNGKNPITKEKCEFKESFVNANRNLYPIEEETNIQLKNLMSKPVANLYAGALGVLMVYILYKLLYKTK